MIKRLGPYKIFFIFLLIPLQIFSSMNVYFINYFVVNNFQSILPSNYMLPQFLMCLSCWRIISSVGRISGAFLIGKYTNNYTLSKAINSVSLGYFVLSLLFLAFYVSSKIISEIQMLFYVFRYFYMLLAPACIILPSIYLFSKTPESKHKMVSACIALATILGLTATYSLKYLPEFYLNYWPALPVLTTGIAYFFYKYVCDTSDYSTPQRIDTNNPVSLKNKILGVLLGSACATAVTFHSLLLNDYVINVRIIDKCNLDFSGVTYFLELAFFILPCAKIFEKISSTKTILIALSMMIFLSITFGLLDSNGTLYALHQILFAISSAILIAPSLKFLNELFKERIFDNMFWVATGFSLCFLIVELAGMILHMINLGLPLKNPVNY